MLQSVFDAEKNNYAAYTEIKYSYSATKKAGTTISRYYLRRGEISGINVFIGYIVRASNKGARKKKVGPSHIFLKCIKNALKEDLIRVVENLDSTVESTDTIVKLKTKIENSSTFESDPDFVKTLIQNCIDERVSQNEREVTLEKQKIELAKLQLAKLEKEIELQTAKNKALSLNPAAKVEDKQFETNIENMIKTLAVETKEKRNRFEQTSRTLQRKISMRSTKDQLVKKDVLMPVKNNVFLWNLPDVEEVPSHDGGTV
ncbi:hypothetical protein TNCV_4727211 [Trichonephila clavipes]|nr:hypothetical protein TNCV_4727211 [Trichonephila clavipes]